MRMRERRREGRDRSKREKEGLDGERICAREVRKVIKRMT